MHTPGYRIVLRGLAPLALALLALPASARSVGTLEFSRCELHQPGTAATVDAECATLRRPENPAAPDGAHITLKIALIRARASEPAPDPVVYFAGGPGQSATESWPLIASGFQRILATRNVLLVDQRGTGGSAPLACDLPDALADTFGSDTSPTTVAAQQQMAVDCLQTLRHDPRFFTTSIAVSDIEAVRRALGDARTPAPQLNLYGGSYGTRVAQEYLRRHPAAVRSVILDGVVPPQLALGSEHAQNLEAGLQAIFAQCTAAPACAKAFGDPFRTLVALRDRLRAQPRQVHLRDPVDHTALEQTLSADVVAAVARLYAYAPESAALLPLLIDEAAKGRPQSLLAQFALIHRALSESLMLGMQLAVTCSEDAPLLRVRADEADLILGNVLVGVTLNQCAVWPRGAMPADFHAPLHADTPALLLSGEFDPVTPPRYGEQVLRGLRNGRHLVGRGQGHLQLARGCFPKLAATFIDTLDAQALDAACLDVLGPTPFFLDYNGAAP